tara:strand:+ start:4589 stop:5416 length:828 start_codon:yes stop_codon:yes gene_type:complete
MNGLRNLGNTCYLNAGLQMLLNNIDFSNIILKVESNDIFIKQFQEFIRLYFINKGKTLVPKFIKNYFETNNIFLGYEQQDSEEFITKLLTVINEKIGDNIIDNVFKIMIKTTIKCKVIGCLKKKFNSENSIKLMFEINSKCNNLDDCYRLFKISEKLDKDNMVCCENCHKKTIASRRAEVEEWPNNLMIVLKRFKQHRGLFQKNSKEIEIPLEWRKGYKLKGFVCHSGSIHGGHYVYVGNINNDWYLYDDNFITNLNINTLEHLKNNAYIYYYTK